MKEKRNKKERVIIKPYEKEKRMKEITTEQGGIRLGVRRFTHPSPPFPPVSNASSLPVPSPSKD